MECVHFVVFLCPFKVEAPPRSYSEFRVSSVDISVFHILSLGEHPAAVDCVVHHQDMRKACGI